MITSKYAWRELAREDLPKRSASERVSDFLEIYGLLNETTAREQASRCVQCPNPSCVGGCPLCNPIPEWMLLTAEGRFLEASAALGSASNLPEICARLCPNESLCEASCLLNSVSEPVSIRAIEQFLGEYAAAHGHVDASTAPPNGRRVAVLGSGPAGLACADELAKRGYAVTLMDSALVPGGLLVNGVPAFKLDRSLIQRRIEILQKRGVVFRLGAVFGDPVGLGALRKEFDAVFVGLESRQARPLEIPNAHLPGVVQALAFLLQKTTAIPLELPPLDLSGARVVVIGGGDTAIDCLRAALRYGARKAVGIYRRAESEMSCSRQEYQNAVEEGARFIFEAAPVAVLGDAEGRVRGLRLTLTQPAGVDHSAAALAAGAESRLAPPSKGPLSILPGTEFEIETEWVVAALGFQTLPCPRTGGFEELALDANGGIIVDADQMTNLPGVFAGGDLVRGPSLVLHTVRDARRAALAIDARLQPGKA